jgi:hypothetical protein
VTYNLLYFIKARSLREHGEASTSFSPMLLSCAAEIRDHSDSVTRKIVTLPDWSAVRMDDPRITRHPRFAKTIGYRQPDQATPPPTIAALTEPSVSPTFPPATMAPSPVLSPVPMDTSDPAGAAAPKFNLFVAGKKRKAKDHGEDIQVSKTEPKAVKSDPKPREDIARSSKRRKIARSKKFVSDDEQDNNGAVIFVKKVSDTFFIPTALIDIVKPGTSAPTGHVAPVPAASTSSTLSNLTDVDELEEPRPSCADSPVIRVRSCHVLSSVI